MLLIMEGLFMIVCTVPSFYELLTNFRQNVIAMETKAIKILFLCALITIASGSVLYFSVRKKNVLVDKRTGFLIVTIIWTVCSVFGSLPYIFGGYINNVTDAYFETMSGFTTTGASILTDVESLPYGIGLWRIMTEWIGGIGIIVIML
ncbi:MAG: TrkH family potassium uptake protein, partial [Bacteroidales bacterium]|nr:TrkH family potassium uptake protein [Bacteroidales bacterium]